VSLAGHYFDVKEYSRNDFKRIIECCPRLTSVVLKTPPDDLLIEIGRSYPDLLSLDLNNIFKGSTKLIALFDRCRKLQKLNILCVKISDNSWIRIFECCHDLRSVRLDHVAVKNAARALFSLAVNCPQLEKLDLEGITASKKEWLQFSKQSNFPKLHTIYLTELDIDDHFVLEFVRKSPLLRNLIIESCECVTDVGLYHVANHCRNLKNLN